MTRHVRWLAVLVLALIVTVGASGAHAQVEAPYGLFVAVDGEMKSEYSPGQKSTVVQLALTPPGLSGTGPSATMVFWARFAGREPEGPPAEIRILVLPIVTSSPNVVRDVEMQLTIEHHKTRPLTLSYFGQSWGEYGFVPPGGEITRVAFTMSPAELRALGFGEQVTGEVMNSAFAFTEQQLAALQRFALAVGIADDTQNGR
jgi:hypothetical protein